jgi:hypothetical protein
VDTGVLARLDDVVGDGACDRALVLTDREDRGEPLRGVVVVPDLDEVRGIAASTPAVGLLVRLLAAALGISIRCHHRLLSQSGTETG